MLGEQEEGERGPGKGRTGDGGEELQGKHAQHLVTTSKGERVGPWTTGMGWTSHSW